MSSNDNSLELFMNDLAELPKILEWFSNNADKIPIGLILKQLNLTSKYSSDMKKLYEKVICNSIDDDIRRK